MPRVLCPRCRWRKDRLEDPEDEKSPSSSCHSESEFRNPMRRSILDAWHSEIPAIWLDILRYDLLLSPSLCARPHSHVMWLRFALRQLQHPQSFPDRHFAIEGMTYQSGTIVGPVYHNTMVQSLVRPNPWAPGSQGILRDGARLKWGTCTHHGNSGVNFYCGGTYGVDTFSPGTYMDHPEDAWVSLEIFVTTATKLRQGRYCINAREDKARHMYCLVLAIRAIWVPYNDAPNFLKV